MEKNNWAVLGWNNELSLKHLQVLVVSAEDAQFLRKVLNPALLFSGLGQAVNGKLL
jgi:hypothetical protein